MQSTLQSTNIIAPMVENNLRHRLSQDKSTSTGHRKLLQAGRELLQGYTQDMHGVSRLQEPDQAVPSTRVL